MSDQRSRCSCPAGTYDFPNAVHESYCSLAEDVRGIACDIVGAPSREGKRLLQAAARLSELEQENLELRAEVERLGRGQLDLVNAWARSRR